MDQNNDASSGAEASSSGEITAILAELEKQLANLDRIGCAIAAIHLDAAIQQLRLDAMRAPTS